MLIGIVASAALVLLDTGNVPFLFSVSFFLGISLGLGFPSCLAYFGDYTFEQNRGRLGGIIFFVSGLSMLIIGFLISISNFAAGVLILTFWRGLGLVIFLLVKPKQENKLPVTAMPYKSILLDRYFVLYFIPWLMFCLVNFFETPLITNFFGLDLALLIPIAEFGIGGFSALVGGWFADSVGRKRVVISGFIMIGVGYAILGLFSNITASWYLYIILDGMAWGIFSLIFYLVIWADLSGNRIKEKYYLLGTLPFIVSGYIPTLLKPFAQSIPISVAFSLASFFLFLAVLPLLYAPETLSEKEIEKKRLQKYLEDVEKVKKKYEKR
jgi:MFS family permease